MAVATTTLTLKTIMITSWTFNPGDKQAHTHKMQNNNDKEKKRPDSLCTYSTCTPSACSLPTFWVFWLVVRQHTPFPVEGRIYGYHSGFIMWCVKNRQDFILKKQQKGKKEVRLSLFKAKTVDRKEEKGQKMQFIVRPLDGEAKTEQNRS